MGRIILGIGLLMLAACSGLEHHMDLTDTYVEGDTLYISGTLNAKTYDEIADLLDDNPGLKLAVLEEIDGSIDDEVNLQTGLLIHEAGLATYVPSDGIIESGAVDLFCAGRPRYAAPGAHIGVHAWQAEDGTQGDALARDDEQHDDYINYFETVGCPVSFYWYTLEAATADDMYIMSQREWLEQGVVSRITTDPIEYILEQSHGSELLRWARWQHRLLLVCDENDEVWKRDYMETQTALIDWAGYAERDLTLVHVSSDSYQIFRTDSFASPDKQNHISSISGTGRMLSDMAQCPSTGMTLTLVGKDGKVKDRWRAPVSNEVLFGTIDAMPMRQKELREKLQND